VPFDDGCVRVYAFPADDFDDALQEILIALIAVARKKRIEVLR